MADRNQVKIPNVMPLDPTRLPSRLPKVEIDKTKCTVPFWCKKCLEACPQLVFFVYCRELQKLRESDPREPNIYELVALRRDKCNLCNKCVDVCPEDAITITY